MKKTRLGCTILEGNDVANLPLVSQNSEILDAEIKKVEDNISKYNATKEEEEEEVYNNIGIELDKKLNKNGDTATGILKAYNNTSYTTAQMRNIILSPSDADVQGMQDGEIWIKYK